MSNELTVAKAEPIQYSREQIDLIKRTFAHGATDDEFQLFIMTAQRLGLRPEARQIHMVKRPAYDPDTREYVQKMSIQTGIDGYRLIADRTQEYAPGRESSYVYGERGELIAATSYVKKFVRGEWHECAATAHFDEYAQKKKDGQPTQMWATKPHIMLAKCAEALALRRAFPAELSGVYTDEEMAQADNAPVIVQKPEPASNSKPVPSTDERIAKLLAWVDAGNSINADNMKRINASVEEIAASIGFALANGDTAAGRLAALVAHIRPPQPATTEPVIEGDVSI
jgi:phage recombination protein Bet